MNRILTLALTILCLAGSLKSAGQVVSKDPPEVAAVFEALYDYDFPDAEKKFRELYRLGIAENLMDLTQANLYWWFMISGDTSKDYENLIIAVLNRAIQRLKAKDPEQLTYDDVFTMIHGYAYLTRVEIYRERYLAGLGNLRRTLDYLKVSLDHYAEFDKFMLTAGLFHYFSAVTVSRRPLYAPFFAIAPKADRRTGFELLTRCSSMENPMLRNEALYFLMIINSLEEKNFPMALKNADQLIRAHPNNLIYHYNRMVVFIEADDKEGARQQFANLVKAATTAPGLSDVQRAHSISEAKKRLRRENITPLL